MVELLWYPTHQHYELSSCSECLTARPALPPPPPGAKRCLCKRQMSDFCQSQKIPPEEVHLRLMLDTELGVSIVYTQAMVEMRGLYIAGIDNDGTITQADKDVTLEKIRAWKIQNGEICDYLSHMPRPSRFSFVPSRLQLTLIGLITDPRRPPSSSEPSESSDSEEEGSSIASSPTVNIPADDYTTGLASNRPPQV